MAATKRGDRHSILPISSTSRAATSGAVQAAPRPAHQVRPRPRRIGNPRTAETHMGEGERTALEVDQAEAGALPRFPQFLV